MKRNLAPKLAGITTALATLAPLAARAENYDYDYSTTSVDNTAAAGLVGGLIILWLIIVAVALALFIFWIVMLVDALKRENWKDESQKTTWLIVLIVGFVFGLSGIAAIVYYFAVKRALDKPKSAPATPAKK